MSVSKKSIAANRYRLGGSLKKSGLNFWRFVFSGTDKDSGTERMFFVELFALNPYLSPADPVLGFKTRPNISEEDLQNVLAGTAAARQLEDETMAVPSYVALRAGVLGEGAKHVCAYRAVRELKISRRSFYVDAGDCSFTEDRIYGGVRCTPGDLREHPEYLCSPGSFSWDLRYEILHGFSDGYRDKTYTWLATGARTVFSGSVTADGREYAVVPKASHGYIDRNWGKTLPETWFHISASNLTSIISGRTLQNSCFTVQGLYGGKPSILLSVGDNSVSFCADSDRRAYESIWDCSQAPESDAGERLHWSVSANDRHSVVDIDVFCLTQNMFVRSVELPEGGRKTLKILCGTGTGELRLYRRVRKNLELIEHTHIAGALCEFGRPDA